MKFTIARCMLVLAGLTMIPGAVLAVIAPPKPNPLAAPSKAVHDAMTNLETVKKQLLVIRKKVEVTFQAKPEYKTAKANLDKSKAEYDAATRKVTANLEKNPDYKALEVKRDKAQAVLDQESNPKPAVSGEDPVKLTDEEIQTASKDRTEAGLAIRDMQKSAADNDPTVSDLHQKYVDAGTAWDAVQAQIDDALKLDPEYPQVEQAVTQAEAQLKQARDSLAQAAIAARQADEAAARARAGGGGGAGLSR